MTNIKFTLTSNMIKLISDKFDFDHIVNQKDVEIDFVLTDDMINHISNKTQLNQHENDLEMIVQEFVNLFDYLTYNENIIWFVETLEMFENITNDEMIDPNMISNVFGNLFDYLTHNENIDLMIDSLEMFEDI